MKLNNLNYISPIVLCIASRASLIVYYTHTHTHQMSKRIADHYLTDQNCEEKDDPLEVCGRVPLSPHECYYNLL